MLILGIMVTIAVVISVFAYMKKEGETESNKS